MTNKNAPHIVALPWMELPAEARDLLEIFREAGFEGSMVYGGYIRDSVAQKLPNDMDVLAFLPSDQIFEDPFDLAEDVRNRIWDVAGDAIDQIKIVRTSHDEDRDNNFARLRFTFNDRVIDLQVVEGEVDLEDAFDAQILGADAPINGFAATLESGVHSDNRALSQLNQRIYEPSPAREFAEVRDRFAKMAKRYPGLTLVEPNHDWTPPVRIVEFMYYD